MDDFQILKQQVDQIQQILNVLVKSDRYTFQKDIQMLEERNIQVGKSKGTQIGTEAAQKVSLHGVAPTIQQSKINDPTVSAVTGGDTVSASAIATNFTNTSNAIDAIIDVLEAKGLSSSS